MLLKFVPLSFTALLPVINPVGSSLVFLGLVGDLPAAQYKRLARMIAIDTAMLLFVVDLGGALILDFFGISLPVVQLAGGGVLAAMGWSLLNEEESRKAAQSSMVSDASTDLESRAFYPLTFPVTAGPGCIVVVLTLGAHAQQRDVPRDIGAHAGILLGNLLVCVLVYLSYGYAPQITRHVSRQTLHGILRIIAFVLLCIGVQIAWMGLQGLVPALKTP